MSKIDIEALRQRETLNFEEACMALEIGARHLRRLIELGELERIGKGHFKRVTTKSIRGYLGDEK